MVNKSRFRFSILYRQSVQEVGEVGAPLSTKSIEKLLDLRSGERVKSKLGSIIVVYYRPATNRNLN